MWPRKQQFWNFRRNTSKFQNGDCDLTDTQGRGLRAVSDPRAPGEALTRRGVGTTRGGTEAWRGQFSPRAQGSSGESQSAPISYSCILWVGTGHRHGTLPARGWKHLIYQKNGRKPVGPPWMKWSRPHSQHPHRKAQLPSRDGFHRKGLNSHLPRRIKPGLEMTLRT